jgi:hypothetical protein
MVFYLFVVVMDYCYYLHFSIVVVFAVAIFLIALSIAVIPILKIAMYSLHPTIFVFQRSIFAIAINAVFGLFESLQYHRFLWSMLNLYHFANIQLVNVLLRLLLL